MLNVIEEEYDQNSMYKQYDELLPYFDYNLQYDYNKYNDKFIDDNGDEESNNFYTRELELYNSDDDPINCLGNATDNISIPIYAQTGRTSESEEHVVEIISAEPLDQLVAEFNFSSIKELQDAEILMKISENVQQDSYGEILWADNLYGGNYHIIDFKNMDSQGVPPITCYPKSVFDIEFQQSLSAIDENILYRNFRKHNVSNNSCQAIDCKEYPTNKARSGSCRAVQNVRGKVICPNTQSINSKAMKTYRPIKPNYPQNFNVTHTHPQLNKHCISTVRSHQIQKNIHSDYNDYFYYPSNESKILRHTRKQSGQDKPGVNICVSDKKSRQNNKQQFKNNTAEKSTGISYRVGTPIKPVEVLQHHNKALNVSSGIQAGVPVQQHKRLSKLSSPISTNSTEVRFTRNQAVQTDQATSFVEKKYLKKSKCCSKDISRKVNNSTIISLRKVASQNDTCMISNDVNDSQQRPRLKRVRTKLGQMNLPLLQTNTSELSSSTVKNNENNINTSMLTDVTETEAGPSQKPEPSLQNTRLLAGGSLIRKPEYKPEYGKSPPATKAANAELPPSSKVISQNHQRTKERKIPHRKVDRVMPGRSPPRTPKEEKLPDRTLVHRTGKDFAFYKDQHFNDISSNAMAQSKYSNLYRPRRNYDDISFINLSRSIGRGYSNANLPPPSVSIDEWWSDSDDNVNADADVESNTEDTLHNSEVSHEIKDNNDPTIQKINDEYRFEEVTDRTKVVNVQIRDKSYLQVMHGQEMELYEKVAHVGNNENELSVIYYDQEEPIAIIDESLKDACITGAERLLLFKNRRSEDQCQYGIVIAKDGEKLGVRRKNVVARRCQKRIDLLPNNNKTKPRKRAGSQPSSSSENH